MTIEYNFGTYYQYFTEYLIVLLCIFILGGDSIRSFAFAMILGVVFGTLSSLFVASPIAYLLMKNKKSSELGEASK